jgi:hypothetical protein
VRGEATHPVVSRSARARSCFAEGLEADAAAVQTTDDAVDRSPLPDCRGVDASAEGQTIRSGSQVIAEVWVAAKDRTEVAGRFGPQPVRVDELETAVARREGVGVVDVAVHQHRVPVGAGSAASLGTFDRVVQGCPRARPSGELPQLREALGVPAGSIGSSWQVSVVGDRAPQSGREVAEHVVSERGVGDDFIHRGPKSLEQERDTVVVDAEQLRTAMAVSQAEHVRLPSSAAGDPRGRRP